MIQCLAFERTGRAYGNRIVRAAKLERRSALPVSAACVVANGVRETLSTLLRQPVTVRLLEPVVPDADAWALITCNALLYRVRGPLNDAMLILRPSDALALTGAVFGERSQELRPLSAIEEQVLARAVRSLASMLAPVCGAAETLVAERCDERAGLLSYFELLVDGPVAVRIGVALSRDPAQAVRSALRIEDLAEVEIELTAEFAAGEIEAGNLLLLQPNATLRMDTKVGAPAALKVAGRTLARGECGALGEHSAFVVSGGSKGGNS